MSDPLLVVSQLPQRGPYATAVLVGALLGLVIGAPSLFLERPYRVTPPSDPGFGYAFAGRILGSLVLVIGAAVAATRISPRVGVGFLGAALLTAVPTYVVLGRSYSAFEIE